MNRVFSIVEPIRLPDGTLLSEIVGLTTVKRSQNEAQIGVSLAFGTIEKFSASEIHLHPIVTQITFVLSGKLTVKMKGPQDELPYLLELTEHQSVLTQPGTFFQLINESDRDCETLYLVSPEFVFEADDDGNVTYNDALVLGKDWEELARRHWCDFGQLKIGQLKETRAQAMARLLRKQESLCI